MKKIVGIMAAAALATSAFAEINVSSWGRMDVIPLNFAGENAAGDKEVLSGAGANWDGAAGGKVGKDGVSFSGSTENAGMALDIQYAGSSLGVGDNANLWVKPVDMLKLTFGKVDYNNGRQELAYGTFAHTWRLQGLNQGEGGFSVDGRGVDGFVINLNPIDNLWFDYAASVKADKAYKTLWNGASFGVGYNIPDVAKIRAIVIGKDGDGQKTKDGKNVGCHAVIQAAADITPVEGLFLTVGASVPTTFGNAYSVKETKYKEVKLGAKDAKYNYTPTGTFDTDGNALYTRTESEAAVGGTTYYAVDEAGNYENEAIKASIGANYTLDMLTFHGFFDSKIGVISGQDKRNDDDTAGDYKNSGFGYAVGLGVDVAFTDSLSLITDCRFSNDVYQGVAGVKANDDGSYDAVYNRGKFGAYVGLCQALTNGFFDVGVEFGCNKTVIQALDNSFTVAIPLQIQVGL
ncbi:hypothetical protein [Treponema sp. C6A8]|uniref:hypothetical protein n=1 Tax=Treponema sp. C6A8 TaxID=1410609 RepID=UPI0004844C67|nr:hypothetical protein [Treponema sp. C6A8]